MLFEKMERLVSDESPRHCGWCRDGDQSRFLAQRESRYLLFVVSCWPLPGNYAVFPSVPRTLDVFARNGSFAEWASLMVAAIPDRMDLSLVQEDGNRMLVEVDREGRPRFDLVRVAEDVPGLVGIHIHSGL